jgi:hypothetical protein
MKLLGTITDDFDVIDQLLIRYSAFVTYWRKWNYNGTVPQLFINFKKACDLVTREVFHILIEFGTRVKLVRVIKM